MTLNEVFRTASDPQLSLSDAERWRCSAIVLRWSCVSRRGGVVVDHGDVRDE